MRIGIVPNTSKDNITEAVGKLCSKLNDHGFDYLISNKMYYLADKISVPVGSSKFVDYNELGQKCDIVISIGGDGTMLNTLYEMRKFNTPVLGLNLGKLGFLAEYEMHDIDELIDDLKNDNYTVEERIGLEAIYKNDELFAVNDLVLDKGKWPKMIDLTIKVEDEYVSTFSADGLIVATPTGSTGYSLSTGGPIITPTADVLVISPISPHTLTMRPLVISANQKIEIKAHSEHTSVQVNCDGQRVTSYNPPFVMEIRKSKYSAKLVHTKRSEYFEILRKKLYWGLDVRTNNNNNH